MWHINGTLIFPMHIVGVVEDIHSESPAAAAPADPRDIVGAVRVTSLPEPWLRGPLPEIPFLLQPVAHALVMSREDVTASVADITAAELWLEPGGAASLGFHLAHLSGATDRLFTYARGERLSPAQRETLSSEGTLSTSRPLLAQLLDNWHRTIESAFRQLSATSDEALLAARLVGRAQLPSTVLGLLFHAAEHASRHTGQVVTTAKLVRAQRR